MVYYTYTFINHIFTLTNQPFMYIGIYTNTIPGGSSGIIFASCYG